MTNSGPRGSLPNQETRRVAISARGPEAGYLDGGTCLEEDGVLLAHGVLERLRVHQVVVLVVGEVVLSAAGKVLQAAAGPGTGANTSATQGASRGLTSGAQTPLYLY